MVHAIYALNLLLVLSCLLDARIQAADRRLARMLLRLILCLLLLTGLYVRAYFDFTTQWVAPFFFSENIFSLMLLLLAYQLQGVVQPTRLIPAYYRWALAIAATTVCAMGAYWLIRAPAFTMTAENLLLPNCGQLYFSSLFCLVATLIMAWRLETFWRQLTIAFRWQYKYLVVGFFLILASMAWSSSYRLTYLGLAGNHLLLLALLLPIGWLLILYTLARHRLLNRRIFISRQVIYSTIAPTVFALYLIALGLISLVIRASGWSLPFVLQWLLIVLGLLGLVILALFSTVRGRIKYFISTHFYLNKYEYRDRWMAFSNLLQGRLDEKEVATALGQILRDTLYTSTILIWLGDARQGFTLIEDDQRNSASPVRTIAPDNPLVAYLQNQPYFYREALPNDSSVQIILDKNDSFWRATGVMLMTSLMVSGQCVGLIGLGPEYTGGKYGRDDFDLLSALGSQAAAAILAARTAEQIAHVREQSAWDTLSASVLHDIKNAATMLGLVRQNAPDHIHDPEFQQDILVSIDDALKRMNKVQTRLNTLKGEIAPVLGPLAIAPFLDEAIRKLSKKLPGLEAALACPESMTIRTDPDFLTQILENLLLNALEAEGTGGHIKVKITVTQASPQEIEITLTDNGLGIPPALLPDRLFEPFITTKEKGSGIGLWQVKRMVESLGGAITANNINSDQGGACFRLRLPIAEIEKAKSKSG